MSDKREKHYHRGKRVKQKHSVISNIALIIAIIVFLLSAFKLYQIFSEYKKGENEYEKIQKLAVTKNEKTPEGADPFRVDFEALKGINPDVIGWIRFDEPSEINYPIVQGEDNEEYLTRTFEANDYKLGTLFADVGNKGDFSDRNTFIYGHNMKNKTMFAQLLAYEEQDFYKKNPYFYIYTPDGKVSKYQIFSAGVVKDTSGSYQVAYESDEAYQAYLDLIRAASAYDTQTEVNVQSQIVSLSTCTNVRDEDRLLVHGVKIGTEDQ